MTSVIGGLLTHRRWTALAASLLAALIPAVTASAATVTVTNGGTAQVHVGDTVIVNLPAPGTEADSDASVLKPLGGSVTRGDVVTARFLATKPGRATVLIPPPPCPTTPPPSPGAPQLICDNGLLVREATVVVLKQPTIAVPATGGSDTGLQLLGVILLIAGVTALGAVRLRTDRAASRAVHAGGR